MLAALAGAAAPGLGANAAASSRGVHVGWLAGTLTMPASSGKVPAVVIVAGSGPTDRDGNNAMGVSADSYKLLADGLSALGVASLRYDKRGIGWSRLAAVGMGESDFTIGTFVDDAVSAARWLRKQENIGPIALLGHSEGGLVSILAAKEADAAGLVLLCAGGRKFGDVLREQLSRPGPPPEAIEAAMRVIAALERGETVTDLPEGLESFFRPSIQPFLRSEMGIDPAQRLAALSQPVMIVGGGADIQIRRIDFDKLTVARPDATALWEPDMTHMLKIAGSAPDAQQRTYVDPSLPIAEGLVPAIGRFVLALS